MKKIFTLLTLIVFVSNFAMGQGSESFESANLPSSYSDGSYTGDNSVVWNYVQSRDDAGYEITNEGIMLRRSGDNSKVYSDAVAGGIGDFSCDLLKAYTGSGNRQVELYINGVSKGTSAAFDDTDVHHFSVTGINVSGNVVVEIRDITSKQVIVDNISWTGFSSSNDTDSEGADTGSQPTGVNISSVTNDDSNNPVSVFEIEIYDWGTADGLPTKVTNIRLKPNTTNTASWLKNIQGVIVDDGTNYLTPSSVNITDTEIDIAFSSTELNVADNSTTEVNIAVYLNTSNIEDNKILSFMVDVDDHGFTADASGSAFKAVFDGGDFYSNDFTIDVTATELQYLQQPSDVAVNSVMTPDVEVAYTDENGNVDVDMDGADMTVTSTGTFDGSATTTETTSLGIATFDNLVFSAQGTDETITATDDDDYIGTNETIVSSTFDVTEPAAAKGDIVINEFMADPDCEAQDVGEYVELYNTTGSDIDIEGWTIEDDGSDNHTFNSANGTTIVPAGGYLVCGRDINSEADPDYEYSFILANSGDEIVLKEGAIEICRVDYSSSVDGKSYELPFGYDYSDADDGVINSNEYVESSATYGCGDYGTPGKTAIPIELLSFSAEKINDNVQVSWSTLTEENNDYVAVEWSRGGIDFKEIAKVDGAGTSRELQEYSYTHNNPANGVNYYRLTQYDLDGRSETYNVVSVTFDSKSKEMFIVPNKVDNSLNIEFSQTVENGRLHIFNMSGKRVQSFILAKGVNTARFDISNLVSGQYILKYVDSKLNSTKSPCLPRNKKVKRCN